MGRDAGDIALNSGIGAGAEEVLLPEEDHGVQRMMDSLEKSKKAGKTSSIIVVAEGEKSGKNIFELAEFISESHKEYDIRVSVLGHIQRGGSPSCFDRVLASKLGVGAVEALTDGETNVMVGLHHQKVVHVPLKTALEPGRELDKELRRVADITSV
jgi:6-phosphofructokinase 1